MGRTARRTASLLGIGLTLLAVAGCDRAQGPTVTAVWPATPASGGELRISGNGFGNAVGSVRLADLQLTAGYVLAWSDDLVRVQVPTSTVGGSVAVVTADGKRADSGSEVRVVAELVVERMRRAEGTSRWEVVALAVDVTGAPVPGVPVAFVSDISSMTPAEAFTGPDGTARSTLDMLGQTGSPRVHVSAVGRLTVVAEYEADVDSDNSPDLLITGSTAP